MFSFLFALLLPSPWCLCAIAEMREKNSFFSVVFRRNISMAGAIDGSELDI
jgi:hypothetical protein